MKNCINCNNQINNETTICPYCGCQQQMQLQQTQPQQQQVPQQPIQQPVVDSKQQSKRASAKEATQKKLFVTFIICSIFIVIAGIARVTSLVVNEDDKKQSELIYDSDSYKYYGTISSINDYKDVYSSNKPVYVDKNFFMEITYCACDENDEASINGTITSGTVKKGDKLTLIFRNGKEKEITIEKVKTINNEEKAMAGDYVTLTTNDITKPETYNVSALAKPGTIKLHKSFVAGLAVIDNKYYPSEKLYNGKKGTFYINSVYQKCSFNIKEGVIKPGKQSKNVTITLQKPAPLKEGQKIALYNNDDFQEQAVGIILKFND